MPISSINKSERGTLDFIKMQGCGNDYIFIDIRDDSSKAALALCGRDVGELTRRLSDRHFGIGGDGVVLICPPQDVKNAALMRIFNSDGSEGRMCGNALRCVARYLFDRHADTREQGVLNIETLSGVRRAERDGDMTDMITVSMGRAELRPALIPVSLDGERVIDRAVMIGGREWRITCLSMGNPHCVVFCNDPAAEPAEGGAMLERAPIFPDRANIEFVQVLDRRRIAVRVFERGSGETLACGTGACAAAVAASLCGHCDLCGNGGVTVEMRGGRLFVGLGGDGEITLRGAAEYQFFGSVQI